MLPPQGLFDDDRRSKLTITLANGTVYSGILPHAMEIDDNDPAHTEPSYPVALSFLREHILTIRTIVTEDPPELSFMPVKVVKWVDKGRFTLEAHQAGVYTAAEFYKLIEYYSANNEYQLTRYGPLVTEEGTDVQKWAFDFFQSVVLEESKIKGMMKRTNGQKDFSFNFHNYTIYIKKAGSEPAKATSPEELYNMVTGS